MSKTFLNTPAKEYSLQKVSNGSAPKAAMILVVSHVFALLILLVIWFISHGLIFGLEEDNKLARTMLAAISLFLYVILISASFSYFGFDNNKQLFTDSRQKVLKTLRTVLQVSLAAVGLYLLLTVAN